jgi:hypothetical protein
MGGRSSTQNPGAILVGLTLSTDGGLACCPLSDRNLPQPKGMERNRFGHSHKPIVPSAAPVRPLRVWPLLWASSFFIGTLGETLKPGAAYV